DSGGRITANPVIDIFPSTDTYEIISLIRSRNSIHMNTTLFQLENELKTDPIERKMTLLQLQSDSRAVYGNSPDEFGEQSNQYYQSSNRQVYLSPGVQSQNPGKKQKKAFAISVCLIFRVVHHLLQQNPQSHDNSLQQYVITAMVIILCGGAVSGINFNSTQYSLNPAPQVELGRCGGVEKLWQLFIERCALSIQQSAVISLAYLFRSSPLPPQFNPIMGFLISQIEALGQIGDLAMQLINNTESDNLAYLLKNIGREMSMIINALAGLNCLAGHQANHAEIMRSCCILIVMEALSDPTGTKAGTLNTRDAIKGQSSREFVRALTQNQNSKAAKNAKDLLNKLNK
ncbi:MAG: hypothetical protein EZS28_032635, partial [Streblomastix strix]